MTDRRPEHADGGALPSSSPRMPYGGQAVIEGVMIRGPRYAALACRLPQPDGQPGSDTAIDLRTEAIRSPYVKRPWLRKVPLVRGVVSLYEMLTVGLRALERSANLALPAQLAVPHLPLITMAGDDEPVAPPPADAAGALNGPLLWGTIAVSFSIGLALFVFLPHAIGAWLTKLIGSDSAWVLNLIEGGVRLAIFVAYVGLIGLMKDIQRVFAYHGAEHKVVNAWEARPLGDESPITLAEALPFSVIHPRCGTNFAFIVIFMSILIFALLPNPDSLWLRLGWRMLILPLVVALSFELLRLVGRFRNARLLGLMVLPGMLMQRLTTRAPSEDMVRVALTSLDAVRAAEEEGEVRSERLDALGAAPLAGGLQQAREVPA